MRKRVFILASLLAILLLGMGSQPPPSPASASPAPQVTDTYVAKDGSDSNDCLSAAAACLTVGAAINKVASGGLMSYEGVTVPPVVATITDNDVCVDCAPPTILAMSSTCEAWNFA